ncbi:hypothetical protein DFQ28_004096 [Apophysomyces sp. BC1034]|nr:hypothetical protein DFQ30_001349 [Apophysomyces sp. BC1015]KAG0182453.1 hypothetical protein DFQ29_004075 [Apophysomyces sp. BC1021]KAG0193655.1 hypothetical protein DFQ28_004096 [Apophysomyces sp. BC1034]
MTDPIAPHSAPIAAYMSVHSATNLAYVRYFAKKDDAVSATFKHVNSRGFGLSYTMPDGEEQETFIEFETPLTKRQDIRPVLEAMAKEAETALGLPSSLAGPPPLSAIAKALYAQATHVYTPPEPAVPLDTFYPADPMWQLLIAVGIGALAVLAFSTDAYLARQFPSAVLQFRNMLGMRELQILWNAAVVIHVLEAIVALGICLRRKWYSPWTVLKWTGSTLCFGFASMKELIRHGKELEMHTKTS